MKLEITAEIQQGDFNFQIATKITKNTAGIFGASGAGKSTLLHLISGLKTPDSGKIVLNDKVFSDSESKTFIPPHQRGIGLVFQDGRLFPHMKVEKNLTFGRSRNSGKRLDFAHVIDILELRHLLQRRPANLSGGERQRVAIGRALLSEPELLLLDEPFSAIDMNMRKELLPFISRVRHEFNIPLLIISHDLPDILQLTDYLLLIDNGRLLKQGRCSELIFDDSCSSRLVNSGANSCFTGIITAKDRHKGTVSIRLHAPVNRAKPDIDIFAPYQESFKVGDSVRGQLTPQDVILSAAPVEYISAQNQIRGIITRTKHLGDRTLVEVALNDFKIITEVTSKSSSDFPYEPGNHIWALFKAWAVNYTISSPLPQPLAQKPQKTPKVLATLPQSV